MLDEAGLYLSVTIYSNYEASYKDISVQISSLASDIARLIYY
jgi:hypothetical protein